MRPADRTQVLRTSEPGAPETPAEPGAGGAERYAIPDTDFMEQTTEGKPGISLRLGNKFVSLQSEGEGGRNYTRDKIEGQAGENMPEGKPISEDFPDVEVQTNAATLKNRNTELYNAAKAGDQQAADQLIATMLKHDKLQAIAQAHPGAIIVYPRAVEATGRNKIPAAYASALVEAGADRGLELDTSIVQANKPGHTGADTRHRTIMRTRFSGEVQAGRDYILVDDVYTSGATMRDLKDYIESKGGNVVFITTMAKGRIGTLRVVPTAEEKQELRDKGITDQQLRQYGITNSIDNLTANEAANLRRLLADRRGDRGSSQGIPGSRPPVARVLESPLGEGEGTAESGEVTPRAGGTDSYRPLLPRQQGQKNTALTGSTGQFSTDASSGGLVRNAHRSPADTPGVTSDSAKVRKNSQSTKPMENPQKKSDTAEHVEERLAELNRLEEKEQTSILSGNSADLNSNENYSPGMPGAQSNAPSPAKLNIKIQNAKELAEKMPDFINRITDGGNITAENFAEPLINVFGGNKSIGQVFQNI